MHICNWLTVVLETTADTRKKNSLSHFSRGRDFLENYVTSKYFFSPTYLCGTHFLNVGICTMWFFWVLLMTFPIVYPNRECYWTIVCVCMSVCTRVRAHVCTDSWCVETQCWWGWLILPEVNFDYHFSRVSALRQSLPLAWGSSANSSSLGVGDEKGNRGSLYPCFLGTGITSLA